LRVRETGSDGSGCFVINVRMDTTNTMNHLFIYFAKTMLHNIKLRQNINMHGLLETAGYITQIRDELK